MLLLYKIKENEKLIAEFTITKHQLPVCKFEKKKKQLMDSLCNKRFCFFFFKDKKKGKERQNEKNNTAKEREKKNMIKMNRQGRTKCSKKSVQIEANKKRERMRKKTAKIFIFFFVLNDFQKDMNRWLPQKRVF